ncbi:glycosyltransferase [Streptomyces althioticus]|uniref:glycosyltransferase family 2 protein n=1 Tax=Streptomyces althioticus TaxID=83380 RepID=UPI00387320B8|nr:glycosyltransferase [Streptomyces althioticus]
MTAPSSPDLALIVPCFDVAGHLPRFLASVSSLTILERIQVILVDDGSTDGTHGLLADFADRHAQVQLVTQPNGGPGAARNRGLREVRAPYVAFADADDVLAPDGLSAMLASARSNRADVVVADFTNVPLRPYGRWKRYFGHGDQQVDDLTRWPDLVFSASVWNKLFSMPFLRRTGAVFPEGVLFEDAWFSIPALLSAHRINLLDRPVYEYRQREDGSSIMDSLRERADNYRDHLDLNLHLLDVGSRRGPGARRLMERYAAFTYLGFLRRLPDAPPDLDVDALLPDLGKLYGGISDEVLREFVTCRRDAALQTAARKGRLGAFLADGEERPTAGARLPDDGIWQPLPLNPAVVAHGDLPRYRRNGDRIELGSAVSAADGYGLGSPWTSSSTPLSGVLDPAVCPPRIVHGPAVLQTLTGSTLNVGALRMSGDGVLTLRLPRIDPRPGWADLSAMSWPLS